MTLFDPIISGIVFGLILSVMVGPLFFTLIQTSLQEGFKAGSHFALGAMLSDATYIMLGYFFASKLNLTGDSKTIFGICGGILLVLFGVYQYFKKVKLAEMDKKEKAIHARYTLQGFVLNAANPAVLLFWLSVLGQVKLKVRYETIHEVLFFSCCLISVFSSDLLKAYGAHKIKKILKPIVLTWINRIAGLILFGYGFWMIGKAIGWWAVQS